MVSRQYSCAAPPQRHDGTVMPSLVRYAIPSSVSVRILMRTDYRYASDQSGYIINVLGFDKEWERPDNDGVST